MPLMKVAVSTKCPRNVSNCSVRLAASACKGAICFCICAEYLGGGACSCASAAAWKVACGVAGATAVLTENDA
eukprot:7856396-Alexandrium_andersonii.AAC.1